MIITDATLMLDADISTTPVAKSEEEAKEKAKMIVDDIMRNLESDGNGTEDNTRRRTYVNSLITEVTVKPSDGNDTEFELDLFLRPTIDIVSFLLIVFLVKNGLKLIHRWKNSCHGIFPLRPEAGAIVETWQMLVVEILGIAE